MPAHSSSQQKTSSTWSPTSHQAKLDRAHNTAGFAQLARPFVTAAAPQSVESAGGSALQARLDEKLSSKLPDLTQINLFANSGTSAPLPPNAPVQPPKAESDDGARDELDVETTVQRKCADCAAADNDERDKLIQSKPISGQLTQKPVQRILQSGDKRQPLENSVRIPIENVFGANSHGARIHTDQESHALNKALQAKSFTAEQDVYRSGAYKSGNWSRQELLTHELMHTVQQSRSNKIQRDPLNAETITSQQGIVSVKRLNVRVAPSISAKKIGYLSKNQKIDIIGDSGDWIKTTYKDQEAFVHGDYIKVISGSETDDSGQNADIIINSKLPSFNSMTGNYPKGKASEVKELIGGKVNYGWIKNTCAIRMSRVFNYSGYEIPKKSSGKTISGGDKRRYFFRISDLKKFIISNFGKADYYATPPYDLTELSKWKGIILFEVKVWSDATGHITLWDGNSCINDDCYHKEASSISIWSAK